ncbi:Fc.00g093970.m01.CDS01 [Cosmosporella sp. VM-42]
MLHKLAAILSALALVHPVHSYPSHGKQVSRASSSLPVCGPTVQPCQCPEGTFYSVVTTYGFFPVTAKDVSDITAISFTDVTFLGLNFANTTGQGFEIGSSRTFSLDWDAASKPVSVTEVLTSYNDYPNRAGYNMTWDMGNTPYHYTRKDGSVGLVGGFWSFEELRQVGDDSFFLWSTWSCFGDSFNFQTFHEAVFSSIANILKQEGKSDGSIVGLTSSG